ncbi:pseudaminic acid synthase [Lachnospiraceae bacterium MD1]|uniref:Pseudaminic acid synthase n=1 Tax=Variimorphobacter saccharofermentans TaxID=2755051 RepID=A0A839K6A1_9FIRM|nr:pseudaminic acid synthase [Variimorphobacter saccharofermentans]MBB2184191.1 pseudaminic acid synthase [Variimorphobacter saccharofermentans]
MRNIKIKNRIIGEGYPTYIIAEMSGNHAGSINRAKEIIHMAKECGADCIKLQTYTPDTITIDCDNKYFRINEGTWSGENLYKLYGKAYTPWEWQYELKAEADKVGIDFFSTPFDKSSVDFLEDIGIEFYKIASFELTDIPLIEYVASKGKPIIMSTGMGSKEEIWDALNTVTMQNNNQVAILKCSSAYPAISEDMNLRTIVDMKNTFQVPVGLSDHSMGSIGAITAVALGACIIEKHFCLNRNIVNPDSSFSMEPEEFKNMVNDIRNAEKALGKISYEITCGEMSNRNFRRSIFAVDDIKAGDVFSNNNIRVIRPSYGLEPKYYNSVLGKKALCDIKRGTPLRLDQVEQGELM